MIKLKSLLKEVDISTITIPKPKRWMYVIKYQSKHDNEDRGFVADQPLPKEMKYHYMSEILIEHSIPFTHINKDLVLGFFNIEMAKKAASYIGEYDGENEYTFTPIQVDTTRDYNE